MARTLPILVLSAALGLAAQSPTLPAPDADDGGLTLPPGFRALVVADHVAAGKRVGNSSENLRGIAVAANGDLYG